MMLRDQIKFMVLRAICILGSAIEQWFDKRFRRETVQKILVFQNGGIGDVLRIFPVMETLQRAFPGAAIDVLTEPHPNLFSLFPSSEAIARYIIIDYQKDHATWRGRCRLIGGLRKRKYDLIVSPNRGRGMVMSTFMTFLIGGQYRVGFTQDGSGFLYTTKVKFRADRAIIEQNLDLLRSIGIPCENVQFPIRVPKKEMAVAEEFLRHHGVQHSDLLVAIHAGAKWQAEFRSWPVSRYVALVQRIMDRYGAKVILLGGGDLKKVSPLFSTLMNHGVIDAIGRTTIGQTAGLLQRCGLFIGNDSGPLHLAMALEIPAIGIFGSTLPGQIIAPGSPSVALVKDLPGKLRYAHQPIFKLQQDHLSQLALISVDDVLEAVEKMIGRRFETPGMNQVQR